jgi:L-iditol 2-dehydrogenase
MPEPAGKSLPQRGRRLQIFAETNIIPLRGRKGATMLCATMTSPGKIEFAEAAKPGYGAHDVLLRIRRIGICGSDVHVFHGKHPYTSYPVVQGHEFCGEVAEIGAGVQNFQPGDLVTAPPQIVCGKCLPCRKGRYHICEALKVIGFQAPGVAQEFFVFPESSLLKLPAGFTPETGALVEPAAVAVHAVGRAGNVAGLGVLVLGAGPIGNLVAQVARWRGAREVLVSDVSDPRLAIARQCGITHTVNPRSASVETAVTEAFGADRAAVAFECVGRAETANQAIRGVRKGGRVVVVGVFGECPTIDLGLVQDRELELRGTLMYQRHDYVEAIRCLAERGIAVEPLLTRSFPFRRYLDAYAFIEANQEHAMKIMINLDEPAEAPGPSGAAPPAENTHGQN